MVIVTVATAIGGVFSAAVAAGGFAAFAAQAALSFALGAALNALSPKPSIPKQETQSRGYQVNTKGSALDHQIIYGKVRVGGVIVYDETTGSNNKYLHRIIAFAGHQIEDFSEIYINDELVTLSGDGNVTSPSKYSGKIRIREHRGSPDQQADNALVSESNKWTSNHRLRGIAYLYVRLNFDADVFPNGIPTITATVKGKRVYNPTTSITAWSDNPALCLRDYLSVATYGIGEAAANIDDDLVISAAAVCDEFLESPASKMFVGGDYRIKTVGNTDFTLYGAPNNNVGTEFIATSRPIGVYVTGVVETKKFTCNGAFTTALTPSDLLTDLLSSMGGSLWYSQGKWRMKPAYWTTPVMSLNEDDLRSGISVSTRHSRRDNFNVIKGTFRGAESNWQFTDYPQVTNSAFLDADNGQESVADVDLTFTDNTIEARRLARISLEGNRQQLTVQASFGLSTLALQVGDNVKLSNTRFGWNDKEFQVLAWSFGLTDGLDLQVNMTLRETAESVYDEVDDGVVYEKDNTELLSPFDVPPVGLSSTVKTQVIREKLTNIINLTVSSGSPERIDHVEADFKLSSEPDTEWVSLGSGQLGIFKALDLEDGDYDFRARAINTFGIKSAQFAYLFNVSASGLLAPPADVTGFTAEVNGSVINLDWQPVPDLDLSFYRIRHSPDLTGATWANSTTYVDKVPRPASSVSVPAKAGTYLVRAYDKSQIGSVNYTTVIVPQANIQPLANTITLTDSPTFTGTKSGVEVVVNRLRLDNYATAPSTGEYLFSDYIETLDNTVKRCRVYVTALTLRQDDGSGLFDSAPALFDGGVGFFDDLGGASQFADTDIEAYVSTTQDDPSGNPSWSNYTLIKVADISARAFRFKIQLKSTSNNVTPSISNLTAYVEYN